MRIGFLLVLMLVVVIVFAAGLGVLGVILLAMIMAFASIMVRGVTPLLATTTSL